VSAIWGDCSLEDSLSRTQGYREADGITDYLDQDECCEDQEEEESDILYSLSSLVQTANMPTQRLTEHFTFLDNIK